MRVPSCAEDVRCRGGARGKENRRDISLSRRHIVSRRFAATTGDKSDSEASTGGNRALMVN